jgi:hypothetical protein
LFIEAILKIELLRIKNIELFYHIIFNKQYKQLIEMILIEINI